MVEGREIVRYHADTDDEDALETDEDEAHQQDKIPVKKTKLTSMFQSCIQCEKTVDLSNNICGDCVWHPGEVYHDNC